MVCSIEVNLRHVTWYLCNIWYLKNFVYSGGIGTTSLSLSYLISTIYYDIVYLSIYLVSRIETPWTLLPFLLTTWTSLYVYLKKLSNLPSLLCDPKPLRLLKPLLFYYKLNETRFLEVRHFLFPSDDLQQSLSYFIPKSPDSLYEDYTKRETSSPLYCHHCPGR